MYCCTVFRLDGTRSKYYSPSPEQLEGLLPLNTELIAWRIVNVNDGTVWNYWKDGEDINNPIYKVVAA